MVEQMRRSMVDSEVIYSQRDTIDVFRVCTELLWQNTPILHTRQSLAIVDGWQWCHGALFAMFRDIFKWSLITSELPMREMDCSAVCTRRAGQEVVFLQTRMHTDDDSRMSMVHTHAGFERIRSIHCFSLQNNYDAYCIFLLRHHYIAAYV